MALLGESSCLIQLKRQMKRVVIIVNPHSFNTSLNQNAPFGQCPL